MEQNRVSCRVMFGIRLLAFLLLAARWPDFAEASVAGIAYGQLGNNLPSPAQVVSLLKANGVGKVMIYDTNPQVLGAFMGSGVSLIVQAPNEQLQTLASSSASAVQWVKTNIVPYASIISFIGVGNEVLVKNNQSAQFLTQALQNVYAALVATNLQGSIKVSTANALSVLDAASFPPSNGRFVNSISQQMQSVLQFLSQTGAPFMANVYPYFAYLGANGQVDLAYALFLENPGVTDSSLHYTNLFDAQVDTLIAAMEALGYGNIPVMVTETGWPSGGDLSATVQNANAYNGNLVKNLQNGTPKRPGVVVETYIFALFNENDKPGPEIERHFGLFYPNQTKIYTIDSY